ncbi:MAG: phosphate ABC transporter substrate-binding protein PstS [Chthoniobacterales bacterium]
MKTTLSYLTRFAAVAALLGTAATATAETQLTGAGASFPAPLYQRWAQEFTKENPDIQVNYQSIGSGAGIKQFTAGTVNFGASDAAMKDEEISQVKRGAVMIPATAGSIVVTYNLPSFPNLQLSREAYVDIFLGKITNWSDDAIAKSNPNKELPDMDIIVCTRSDGSGTTFVFTKHLASISEDFNTEVGEGKSVTWPSGVAGKGNEGVTALVKQTPGAVGYVEYGYAKNNGLEMASLENKSGEYVAPTDESATATLASVELPENLRIWPSDPTGKGDYPIVTFTWLLVYGEYPDATIGDAVKKFVEFGLTTGQQFAPELGYVQLPKEVVEKSMAALATVK